MARKSPAAKKAEPQAPVVVMRPVDTLFVGLANARVHSVADPVNKKLLASIEANGILHPLLVSEQPDGRFCVIDGSKRLKAALELKMSHVPTIHVAGEVGLVSIAMNDSVQPMTHFERYDAYRRAVAAGVSDDAITAQLGLDASNRKVLRALASIDPEALEICRSADLSSSAVVKLARIPVDDQVRFLLAAREQSWKNTLESGQVEHLASDYFRGTGLSRHIALLKDAYVALGGRLAVPLFDLGDGTVGRPLDPDLLPAAEVKVLEDAATARTEKTGRQTVIAPSSMGPIYERADAFGLTRFWNTDPTDALQETAAVDAGFADMDDYCAAANKVANAEEQGLDPAEDPELRSITVKLDKYEALIEKITWPENGVELVSIGYDGNIEYTGPYVPAAEAKKNASSTGAAGDDGTADNALALSQTVRDRRDQVYAHMVFARMLSDKDFGLRMTAMSLYQAARTAATNYASPTDLRLNNSYSGQKLLEGFVVDPTREQAAAAISAKPLTMDDFATMSNAKLIDVIVRSTAVLRCLSMTPAQMERVISTFEIPIRPMWDDVVPDVEHAAAWLKQFKKPVLVEFAAKLDPENVYIGRVVAASKKGDAVDALAKALVHGAVGQSDELRQLAWTTMPPGFEPAAVPTAEPDPFPADDGLLDDAGDGEE